VSDGPSPLGDALRQWARRRRSVDLLVITDVRRLWPDLVAAPLAARCVPEVVRDGVLYVRVPTGAFAERLRMDAASILEGLAVLGERAPRALATVVGEVRPRRK
jgi:predicted nucleic acid-binding Zn ribbon protein